MRTLMIFLSFIYLFHRKQIVLQESAINLVFVWKLVSIRLRVDGAFRQTREQRKDYLYNAVKSAPPPNHWCGLAESSNHDTYVSRVV